MENPKILVSQKKKKKNKINKNCKCNEIRKPYLHQLKKKNNSMKEISSWYSWKRWMKHTLALNSSANSLWRLSLGADFPDSKQAPWATERNKHLPSPGIPAQYGAVIYSWDTKGNEIIIQELLYCTHTEIPAKILNISDHEVQHEKQARCPHR